MIPFLQTIISWFYEKVFHKKFLWIWSYDPYSQKSLLFSDTDITWIEKKIFMVEKMVGQNISHELPYFVSV